MTWVGTGRKVGARADEDIGPYEGHGQGCKGGSILTWVGARRKGGVRAGLEPAPTKGNSVLA